MRVLLGLDKPPGTPIDGPMPRIKNLVCKHFRGIPAVIIAIVLIALLYDKEKRDQIALCLWLWMGVFFFLQPVNVPVTSLIPIFFLPFTGTLSSRNCCAGFFNENIALHLTSGMMIMILSNTGLLDRLLLWFLRLGNNTSGSCMLIKASIAAFLVSIVENRQHVTKGLIDIMGPVYMDSKKGKSTYLTMRSVIFNAVQTSSSIGSITVVHSAYSVMAMRTIWYTHPSAGSSFPDYFNYFQYTAFAMPLGIAMFILNMIYHCILFKITVNIPEDDPVETAMGKRLQTLTNALPSKIATYLKLLIFFDVLFHIAIFTRWSPLLPEKGWASFYMKATDVPGIKDCTISSIFVILLHSLPRNCNMGKYMNAKKRSDLKSLRPEASLMIWRYMDSNTNYGYIILFGGGVALNKAISTTNLDVASTFLGKIIVKQDFTMALLLITIMSGVFTNAMSGCAACIILLPLVLNMKEPATAATVVAGLRDDVTETIKTKSNIWLDNIHKTALLVGIATAFGFMTPFKFTPAYPCHYVGKVPKLKMAIFSFFSVVICLVILWAGVAFYSPVIWSSKVATVVTGTDTKTTTAATTAAGYRT